MSRTRHADRQKKVGIGKEYWGRVPLGKHGHWGPARLLTVFGRKVWVRAWRRFRRQEARSEWSQDASQGV